MILTFVSVDKILKHHHEKEIILYWMVFPPVLIITMPNTSRSLSELGLPVVVPVGSVTKHMKTKLWFACLIPVFFFFSYMLILKMWSQKVKLTIRPKLLKARFMLTNVNSYRKALVSANRFWATGPRALVYLHHYSNPTSPDNQGSPVLCVLCCVFKCMDKMPLCKHFHKSYWKLKSTPATFTMLYNVRNTSACKMAFNSSQIPLFYTMLLLPLVLPYFAHPSHALFPKYLLRLWLADLTTRIQITIHITHSFLS